MTAEIGGGSRGLNVMELVMGHNIRLGPIPGAKIFSPSNHSSQLQIVRSSPNSGLKGGASFQERLPLVLLPSTGGVS